LAILEAVPSKRVIFCFFESSLELMFQYVLPLEDIAIVLNSILPNYSKKGLFAFHPALFLSASKDLQLINISQLKVEPMILRQDQY
jgi:hypothetical protein